jgi:hypothetical protein
MAYHEERKMTPAQELRLNILNLLGDITEEGSKPVLVSDFAELLATQGLKDSAKNADGYLRYLIKSHAVCSHTNYGGRVEIWPLSETRENCFVDQETETNPFMTLTANAAKTQADTVRALEEENKAKEAEAEEPREPPREAEPPKEERIPTPKARILEVTDTEPKAKKPTLKAKKEAAATKQKEAAPAPAKAAHLVEPEDAVNHPAHYEGSAITLQPIDFCERLPFCEGNALKYIFRAGKKKGTKELTDLQKAVWYMNKAFSPSALRLSILSCHFDYFVSLIPLLRFSDSPLLKAATAELTLTDGSQEIYGRFWYELKKAAEARIEKLEGGSHG